MSRSWEATSKLFLVNIAVRGHLSSSSRLSPLGYTGLLAIVLGILFLAGRYPAAAHGAPVPSHQVPANPDAVCATCHKAIYESYERTPMAQGSGRAVDGLIEGGFRHLPSGVVYRIFARDGQAWMSYDRPATAERIPLHGEDKLEYYVGSNHRGRTYLYQEEGRWFQTPVNYYSRKALWDMAPGYGLVKAMPPALGLDRGCLHCHATGIEPTLPEADNRYAGVPFRQSGIGCIACHGDPSKHLATGGRGPIVNPAKLTASRRDSTCLQCHLEGDAMVAHPQKSLADFRAGDDLSDYATYFVRAHGQAWEGRATSQYEALLRSACKRASGDSLTCTTCHDPHSQPAESERVAFYRGRCLSCHTGLAIATKHHPEQQDCAVCHMPTRNPTDISHEQSTDHNIERLPSPDAPPVDLSREGARINLVPFNAAKVGDRDLGLAYMQFAKQGDQASGMRALALLQSASKHGSEDSEMHLELGFLDQKAGKSPEARTEYEAVLRDNPFQVTALANLAVLDAREGKVASAVALLTRAVDADPTQTTAGLNLAFVQCSMGDKAAALATLQHIQRFAPDDEAIRRFMASGWYGPSQCRLQ